MPWPAIRAQDRQLVRAVDLLKPGGSLLYAVYSLQDDKRATRIDALLGRDTGLQRLPVQPSEVSGLGEAVTANGDVLTFPSMWTDRGGMDGFYIARLQRA